MYSDDSTIFYIFEELYGKLTVDYIKHNASLTTKRLSFLQKHVIYGAYVAKFVVINPGQRRHYFLVIINNLPSWYSSRTIRDDLESSIKGNVKWDLDRGDFCIMYNEGQMSYEQCKLTEVIDLFKSVDCGKNSKFIEFISFKNWVCSKPHWPNEYVSNVKLLMQIHLFLSHYFDGQLRKTRPNSTKSLEMLVDEAAGVAQVLNGELRVGNGVHLLEETIDQFAALLTDVKERITSWDSYSRFVSSDSLIESLDSKLLPKKTHFLNRDVHTCGISTPILTAALEWPRKIETSEKSWEMLVTKTMYNQDSLKKFTWILDLDRKSPEINVYVDKVEYRLAFVHSSSATTSHHTFDEKANLYIDYCDESAINRIKCLLLCRACWSFLRKNVFLKISCSCGVYLSPLFDCTKCDFYKIDSAISTADSTTDKQVPDQNTADPSVSGDSGKDNSAAGKDISGQTNGSSPCPKIVFKPPEIGPKPAIPSSSMGSTSTNGQSNQSQQRLERDPGLNDPTLPLSPAAGVLSFKNEFLQAIRELFPAEQIDPDMSGKDLIQQILEKARSESVQTFMAINSIIFASKMADSKVQTPVTENEREIARKLDVNDHKGYFDHLMSLLGPVVRGLDERTRHVQLMARLLTEFYGVHPETLSPQNSVYETLLDTCRRQTDQEMHSLIADELGASQPAEMGSSRNKKVRDIVRRHLRNEKLLLVQKENAIREKEQIQTNLDTLAAIQSLIKRIDSKTEIPSPQAEETAQKYIDRIIKERFPPTYTVVFLGESGTGKSTTICSIGNYLKYRTFEEARRNKMDICIPLRFTATPEGGPVATVECFPDSVDNSANENFNEAGQSVTQEARVHTFDYKEARFRIIDTPGLSDTRGMQQDTVNLDKIRAVVNQQEQIHAICLVLKSNESRLRPEFELATRQLLSLFPKKALDNVFLFFTFASGTFFAIGDSVEMLSTLQQKLTQSHGRCFQIQQNTCCIDAESFKYRLCQERSIRYSSRSESSFHHCWDHSAAKITSFLAFLQKMQPISGEEVKRVHNDVESVNRLLTRISGKGQLRHEDVADVEDVTDYIREQYMPLNFPQPTRRGAVNRAVFSEKLNRLSSKYGFD